MVTTTTFTDSSQPCVRPVTERCDHGKMLHSVRYLQSQWNARSPELSLRDWVNFVRPSVAPEALERARRHYHASRVHCFLRGLAVAVDGPLPSTGALLLGRDTDPEFAVGSIRPCLTLDPRGPSQSSESSPKLTATLEAQMLATLEAGYIVHLRRTSERSAIENRLIELASSRHFPVMTLHFDPVTEPQADHPFALRELLIRATPLEVTGIPDAHVH